MAPSQITLPSPDGEPKKQQQTKNNYNPRLHINLFCSFHWGQNTKHDKANWGGRVVVDFTLTLNRQDRRQNTSWRRRWRFRRRRWLRTRFHRFLRIRNRFVHQRLRLSFCIFLCQCITESSMCNEAVPSSKGEEKAKRNPQNPQMKIQFS